MTYISDYYGTDFFVRHHIHTGFRPNLAPVHWVTLPASQELKLSEHTACHSHLTIAEVKNGLKYALVLLCIAMMWRLIIFSSQWLLN